MSNKELKITQREREAFEKEKHKFCALGDQMVKEKINPKTNASDLFDLLPEEQKNDFIQDVLQISFEFLGLRKKKIEDEDNSIAEQQGQEFLQERVH